MCGKVIFENWEKKLFDKFDYEKSYVTTLMILIIVIIIINIKYQEIYIYIYTQMIKFIWTLTNAEYKNNFLFL